VIEIDIERAMIERNIANRVWSQKKQQQIEKDRKHSENGSIIWQEKLNACIHETISQPKFAYENFVEEPKEDSVEAKTATENESIFSPDKLNSFESNQTQSGWMECR
jgi:hypothetical protein